MPSGDNELAKRTDYRPLALTALAVILPLLVLLSARLLCVTEGELASDAYYHAAMAERGPSAILSKSFPALSLSAWRDSFSDKEMGYHMLLWLCFRAEEALGIDADSPPFHAPAMLFCLAAVAAFVLTARRLGATPELSLAAATLLAALTPNFAYRFLMLRPHTLSIAFLLVACALLAKGSFKLRTVSTFALSFLYAWCYSNPHFIVLPALLFAPFLMRDFGRRALLLPLVALGGTLAGLTIHPQFPNSLIIWKIQSIDALLAPLSDAIPIEKPAEMSAPTIKWLLYALPLLALAYLDAMLFVRLSEREGFKALKPELKAIGLLSAIFLGGMFLSLRAVEYACPFVCLLSAMLASEAMSKGALKLPLPARCVAFPALALALTAWLLWNFHSVRSAQTKEPKSLAAWLACKVPEGSTLANLNWGDFPQLVHAAPGYIYLWGMDPMFSYAVDPKRTLKLDSLKMPKSPLGPEDVRSLFGADFAVLLKPKDPLANLLMKKGWKAVYEGTDGWVFSLDGAAADKPFSLDGPRR